MQPHSSRTLLEAVAEEGAMLEEVFLAEAAPTAYVGAS